MIALQHTAWIEDSPLQLSEAELLAATGGSEPLTRDQTAACAGKTQKLCILLMLLTIIWEPYISPLRLGFL